MYAKMYHSNYYPSFRSFLSNKDEEDLINKNKDITDPRPLDTPCRGYGDLSICLRAIENSEHRPYKRLERFFITPATGIEEIDKYLKDYYKITTDLCFYQLSEEQLKCSGVSETTEIQDITKMFLGSGVDMKSSYMPDYNSFEFTNKYFCRKITAISLEDLGYLKNEVFPEDGLEYLLNFGNSFKIDYQKLGEEINLEIEKIIKK